MNINFRKEKPEDRLARLEYEESLLPKPIDISSINGITLRSYQQELFNSTNRVRIAHWGRRTGKSTLAAAIATYELLNNRSVVIAVPNNHLIETLNEYIGEMVNNPNLFIVVPSGPSVCSLSFDTIILDEFEYFTQEMFDSIAPLITVSPDTKVVALSTRSGNNYFKSAIDSGSYFYSTVRTDDPEVGIDITPILAMVSPEVAQQEYLGY